MLTLHSATELVKNVIKWAGIGVGGILLIIFLFRGSIALYKVLFPKPPTPPNVAFGKLPQVFFPKSVTDQTFTYSIDTVTGNLGSFPDRAKVYETIIEVPNLLNLETARERARKIDFTSNEQIISDTVYSWRDSSVFNRQITYNIVSDDFTISSDYFRYSSFIKENTLTPQSAITLVESTLGSMEILPEDIDLAKTSTQLLSIQNSTLFPATSLSTTQIIRVDLFHKDLDKMPIYYPKPPYSTMYFLVAGDGSRGTIVEGTFHHQALNNKNATYPIKSVNQAFDELKSGKGYIAAYYGTGNEIIIKNVSLAYYLGDEKQQYLIPIYVFEGRDGFYGYVSAILDTWFTTGQSSE